MEIRQLPSSHALEAKLSRMSYPTVKEQESILKTVGKLTATQVAKISFFFCFVVCAPFLYTSESGNFSEDRSETLLLRSQSRNTTCLLYGGTNRQESFQSILEILNKSNITFLGLPILSTLKKASLGWLMSHVALKFPCSPCIIVILKQLQNKLKVPLVIME